MRSFPMFDISDYTLSNIEVWYGEQLDDMLLCDKKPNASLPYMRIEFWCKVRAYGQFVLIKRTYNESLPLCDVNVFGEMKGQYSNCLQISLQFQAKKYFQHI